MSIVQNLLKVCRQRFGLLHIEATNLNDIGGIAPGSMGHLVAVGEKDSKPPPASEVIFDELFV